MSEVIDVDLNDDEVERLRRVINSDGPDSEPEGNDSEVEKDQSSDEEEKEVEEYDPNRPEMYSLDSGSSEEEEKNNDSGGEDDDTGEEDLG